MRSAIFNLGKLASRQRRAHGGFANDAESERAAREPCAKSNGVGNTYGDLLKQDAKSQPLGKATTDCFVRPSAARSHACVGDRPASDAGRVL